MVGRSGAFRTSLGVHGQGRTCAHPYDGKAVPVLDRFRATEAQVIAHQRQSGLRNFPALEGRDRATWGYQVELSCPWNRGREKHCILVQYLNNSLSLLVSAAFVAGCSSQPSRPPRSATVVPKGYCSEQYQSQFGWPDSAKASVVCMCESDANPRAVSSGGRYLGLFQISKAGWPARAGDPFDPSDNSRQAFKMFRAKGWKPWPSCSK